MCQNTASSFLSVSGQTRSSRFQLSSGAFSCRVSQISELRAGAEPPQNEALCFCDAQQTSPYPSASFCCSLPFQHLHKTAGPSAVRLPALLLVPPGVSPVWPGQSRRIGACRRCFPLPTSPPSPLKTCPACAHPRAPSLWKLTGPGWGCWAGSGPALGAPAARAKLSLQR